MPETAHSINHHSIFTSTHVPHQAIALFLLLLLPFSTAIKFTLPSAKILAKKCIWNATHPHALVIVNANVGPGPNQRIDIDVFDSTPQRNVYLSKKDINAETRFAVTAHAERQIGLYFTGCYSCTMEFTPMLNLLLSAEPP